MKEGGLKERAKYLGSKANPKKVEVLDKELNESAIKSVETPEPNNYSLEIRNPTTIGKTRHFFKKQVFHSFKEIPLIIPQDTHEDIPMHKEAIPIKELPMVNKQSQNSNELQKTTCDKEAEIWTLKRNRLKLKNKLDEYKDELKVQVSRLEQLRSLFDSDKLCNSCKEIIKPIV